MKGAPMIPRLENRGATRERWSLNSVTDSSKERIESGQLPGFELMFKATGNIKAKRLQEHVDILGAKFKVSVVTGPSGSYRKRHCWHSSNSGASRGVRLGSGSSCS